MDSKLRVQEVTTGKKSFVVFSQILFAYAGTFALAFWLSFAGQSSPAISSASSLVLSPSQNLWLFFGLFVVASVIAIVLTKHLHDDRFWAVFFGLGACAGLFMTFTIIGLVIFSLYAAYAFAFFITGLLLILRQRRKQIWIHNCVLLISLAGLGYVFGSQFSPKAMLIILIVLSLYDFLAVYYSKHMVTVAKTFFQHQAFFGFLFPARFSEWKQSYVQHSPGNDVSVVGAGDVALPLFFALSHLYFYGAWAFGVITFSVFVGVFFLHWIYEHPAHRRPIPGLPPIVLCCIVGYVIVQQFV